MLFCCLSFSYLDNSSFEVNGVGLLYNTMHVLFLFSRDSSVSRGGDTFKEETGIQGVKEVEGGVVKRFNHMHWAIHKWKKEETG